MKKTYTIKVTRRSWMEVTVDDNASQDDVYDIAKRKVQSGKAKWDEPSFNIISIDIDSEAENVKESSKFLPAEDPILKK